MARFVKYAQFGGPEVLEVVEGPVPQAGSGEVVVEVKAAGVNPIDGKLRSGLRASAPLTSPRTTGSDGAGVIVELGPDVEGWAVGDEVIVTSARGSYATHAVVPVSGLTRKPGALSWAQAAGLGVPAGTAYQSLRSLGVAEGMTVLVHGASGAVGQAALQFARELGATVVGTASEANFDRIRQLGGIPVAYGPGLVERVRAVAPNDVDRVLDAAGTDEAIEASLELVDDPQHIATIVRGADAPGWGIRAFSGGSATALTPEELGWRADGIRWAAELAAQGRFDVEIARTLPLDQAVEAQTLLTRGGSRGKIVLLP
ncbi:NADP-dependent oxidoreductase [Protaetiibacter intestinalis]|uniref:NADP-dependent oxidoreductase n=1 Tax=Protaetiibacter intestinalis TaxID=2419774 RepID=A0A387BH41_9MICO|nr:NADP-dependent oxidoreductase [Protaetiibacter intestinalis]AYF97840.1 NADP-dependent oxidoreductase [Protaetiibacter intestinalis]